MASLCLCFTWSLPETFKDLAIKVQEKFEMSNCALLIDSMAIRKQIIYYTAQ